MNIHTKLILNYMGIVLVILLAMYAYLDYSLKQNLSDRISYDIVDSFVDRPRNRWYGPSHIYWMRWDCVGRYGA